MEPAAPCYEITFDRGDRLPPDTWEEYIDDSAPAPTATKEDVKKEPKKEVVNVASCANCACAAA